MNGHRMCLEIVPFGLSSSTAKIAPIMTTKDKHMGRGVSEIFHYDIWHPGSGYPAFVVVQCKSFHIVFLFHSSDHFWECSALYSHHGNLLQTCESVVPGIHTTVNCYRLGKLKWLDSWHTSIILLTGFKWTGLNVWSKTPASGVDNVTMGHL